MLKSGWRCIVMAALLAVMLNGCASYRAGGFTIPRTDKGKYNVAMVLVGSRRDAGWSQAHFESLAYLQNQVQNVKTGYVENVPDDKTSEVVFRALARAGYQLIFGTAYGYQDSMEKVAAEFPDVYFIHLSGEKTNGTNFGNLMGAMEDMKYLAGMVAGARAHKDGNPQLGYIATKPSPQEYRFGNAIALGMLVTCPECTLDVEWIHTQQDAALEEQAANQLFERGAQVVLSGANTTRPIDVAAARGKWIVTNHWLGSCSSNQCLTASYWNWGPVYRQILTGVLDGTYRPGFDYFDASTGGLGLYGFMNNQKMQPGVAELDPTHILQVRGLLDQMLKGEFTRFDVFKGPIYDNQGNLIVQAGIKLSQFDLVQFPEYKQGCETCMKWWAQGIIIQGSP